ncbi:MAG: hypothetical protein ACP5LE_07085, partial [Thermoplasmata archaeon]
TALGAMLLGGLQKVWEAVAKAVNAIINWIIEKVTAIIAAVLDPVIAAMDGYVQGVLEALMNAYDEYDSTGSISESTLKYVNEAFMGALYWALVAVSVAIVVALAIAMPFTATFGTLIGLLVSVIVVVVMMNVFSSSTTEGQSVTGLSFGMSMQAIIDFAKSYAEEQKSGTKSSSGSGDEWDKWWQVLGIVFGIGGFYMGLASAAEADVTGFCAATASIITSFLGLLFSSVALGLISITIAESAVTFLSCLALVLSFEGVIFSGLALLQAKGVNQAALWTGLIGLVLSLIGVGFSILSIVPGV